MSQGSSGSPSFCSFSTRYVSANASPGFSMYEEPSFPGLSSPSAVRAQMFSYEAHRFVP